MGVLATTYGAAVSAIKGLIGKANGIAGLGADGKVPSAQLPASGGGTTQDQTSLAIKATTEGSPAGNTRGDNAVDLQTERGSSIQVASGDYSVICGGDSNRADGGESFIGGGRSNAASGSNSCVAGGLLNAAVEANSTVGGGQNNNTSGLGSTVAGGFDNRCDGRYSTVPGGVYGRASRPGEMSHAPGRFSASGDCQRSIVQLMRSTSGATKTELTTDNSSSRRFTLASTEYLSGRLTVFARRSNGDYARWTFDDVTASRIGSGNVTVDVGGGGGSATGISPDQHTGTGSTCLVDVDADTSNQALRVQVTGNASEDWRWHAIFDGHRGLYGS